MKGHESIRGSGPVTIDQPWEAVVFEGRDCLILMSPLILMLVLTFLRIHLVWPVIY